MKLPIDPHLPNILSQVLANQNVLIQSSPGSGKTTRIPPYLNGKFKNILVIEPRRIAAIYAASRIAEETKTTLGKRVGYEVRFDSQSSQETSILFLTEALLAKKILANPELQSIDLIIFDEFHERSYWTDFAIGHLKELQILGSPIKLIFLSATIDQVPLVHFFEDIHRIEINLPRFPIEIIYQKKPFRSIWNSELEALFLAALHEIIQKGQKQILVFLPGIKEIRNVARSIENHKKHQNFQIEILHGSVPLAEQKEIVSNSNNHDYRIILSTNIAESSLTISGVTAVLDSGLYREGSFNFEYEETQLQTKKISRFSATQRQGRANRLGPGLCFKMWTELDEQSMELTPISDIRKSYLFDLGLNLVRMEHWPMSQFTWFERPSAGVLQQLEEHFLNSNLVCKRKLTPFGDLLLDLNLSYENGVLLILCHFINQLDTGATLIAILENDFSGPETNHIPLSTLLESYDFFKRQARHPMDVDKRIQQIIFGFKKSRTDFKSELKKYFLLESDLMFLDILEINKSSPRALDLIITFSYKNRLCKRRKQDMTLSNRSVTTKSKEIQIGDSRKAALLPNLEYFINFRTFVDVNQSARCFNYHFIDPWVFDRAIRPFCEKILRIEFNDSRQQFYKITELVFKKLLIENLTQDSLHPTELKERTTEILCQQKESLLFPVPKVEDFLIRLALVNKNIDIKIKIDWNMAIEQEVDRGLSLKNRMEWPIEIQNYLSFEDQKNLRLLAPDEITIKELNRSFKVHYPKDEVPFIESRLQHFLGLNSHPCILNGQMKLKILLLGPHGRPIQITTDLPSFWRTSYPEIRKEMRGRYPKHAWPEDPTAFKN